MKRYWFATGLAVLTAVIIGCGNSIVPEGERPGPSAEPTNEVSSGPGTGTPGTSINFSLLSTNGGVLNFSDLRGTMPVGLFFYGGSNCDGCEARLRLMQENYQRFKQIGAELIAVSTDLPEKTRSTVEKIGVEFPVLSDVDGSVSDNWGVLDTTGNGHALPSIFIFGPSGEQIASQVGTSADELPGIDEMLQTVQRSLESGTARPTATPRPARTVQVDAANLLGPGVTDFRLPDAIGGGELSLGETLKDSNVVLVFYRAFW